MSILVKRKKSNYLKEPMFLGNPVTIARYDQLKYPFLDTLCKKQRGFFWQPEEIQDIIKDKDDFRKLSDHEQHIFKANLMRQTLLDSVQGRAPSEAFTPICSVPEAEIWCQTWAFSETIHSYSYTYILRNIFSDPAIVFDNLESIDEVVDCSDDISKYYDDLISYTNAISYHGGYNFTTTHLNLQEHKRRLWLALMAVNILEGVRFYVSFACAWAFAERKLMEGNAKIISLIARDENLHLASTQYMLRTIAKDDKDFAKISKETQDASVKMFLDCVEGEKRWAKYLFKDGSMIGLTENILCDYIDYIARQRMKAIDLPCDINVTANPLPWTAKWIGGKDMQPAPQEVNVTSYVIGGIKPDVGKDTFKDFKL